MQGPDERVGATWSPGPLLMPCVYENHNSRQLDERKRVRYQDMAAADLITFDELRGRLAELDDIRRTAEIELKVVARARGTLG